MGMHGSVGRGVVAELSKLVVAPAPSRPVRECGAGVVLSADGNRIEALLLARIHTEVLLTDLLAVAAPIVTVNKNMTASRIAIVFVFI